MIKMSKVTEERIRRMLDECHINAYNINKIEMYDCYADTIRCVIYLHNFKNEEWSAFYDKITFAIHRISHMYNIQCIVSYCIRGYSHTLVMNKND